MLGATSNDYSKGTIIHHTFTKLLMVGKEIIQLYLWNVMVILLKGMRIS